MSFRDKLARTSEANRSLLCVGLDPDPRRLPIDDVAAFLVGVIEATRDLVCAFKANLAFYEALGDEGSAALRAVRRAVPDDVPLIGDAKRGDVANTSAAYAEALFDRDGFDAVTVNPYLGGDALAAFLEHADRGVIVVCRTSNPGAGEFQDLLVEFEGERRPLYEAVALRARAWNTRGNVALVAGATYPQEMARLRKLCPELPFLAPGIGAQAGEIEAAVQAGLDADGGGMIINASRQVLYASRGAAWADAARVEAQSLRDAIERARSVRLAALASPVSGEQP
jgi:orotidine-5'-phosphate decarboxylase